MLLLWIALVGCKTDDDPTPQPQPTTPVDSTATAQTGSTGDTSATYQPAMLVEGGVMACADRSARTVSAFDRKQSLPVQVVQKEEADLAGGGLALADFDGDGHMDLFLGGLRNDNQLWWGEGNEAFDEQGAVAFAGIDLTVAVGATAVDYDGDGDLDLFVTRYSQPDKLLRNEGDRTFTDVTAAAGIGGHSTVSPVPPFDGDPDRWEEGRLTSQSASWGDIDGDGDLDLFVGTYGRPTILDVTEKVPDCDDHIVDPSELWLNDGDGTFTDASDRLPMEVHDGYVFMSGFYDVDGDGLPELYTSHDDGLCAPSVLLHNTGGTFAVDHASGFHPDSFDMGMGVGDLNGDELPDMLLTSWNGVALVRSYADPTTLTGVGYLDATASMGLTVDGAPREAPGTAQPGQQIYGWGAELGDIDNDNDLDAVMLFGYWNFYTGAGDPLQQNDGLWIQEGGQFTDEAPAMGLADPGVGRGVVMADLNGDGWLDIVKRSLNEPTPMYLSNCGDEAWLHVALRMPGPNTHAVGAKVRVISGETSQVRWIQSGSAGMYSGHPLTAHVGLGMVDTVDAIEVVWPDGAVSRFDDVATRQNLTITRE